MNEGVTETVERFTGGERALHWATALAVILLLGSGFLIWQKLDDWEILEVNVISQGHVWLGGLLLVGAALAFQLWGRRRRVPRPVQRFNAGQRLALRFVQAALGLMTATGAILYLREFVEMSKPFRRLVKQAHLLTAGAVAVFVVMHLVMVLLVPKNRGLLRGMITGRLSPPCHLPPGHPPRRPPT